MKKMAKVGSGTYRLNGSSAAARAARCVDNVMLDRSQSQYRTTVRVLMDNDKDVGRQLGGQK